VRVSATTANDRVRVVVADEGSGVPESLDGAALSRPTGAALHADEQVLGRLGHR
jgi:hypothetical protein